MSDRNFLLCFFGIQLLFCALDLVETVLTARGRGSGDTGKRPAIGPVVFLLGVLGTYGLIQAAGFSLVPDGMDLAAWMRGKAGALAGRELSKEPLQGPGLALLTVFAFYVCGLWDYLFHRHVSHSRYLWFSHEYHHLPRQLNVLMPGVAARPFAVISTFPTTVATLITVFGTMLLAGLPLFDLAPLKVLWLVQVAVLTSSHSSFLRRFQAVHRAMGLLALTTPRDHLLHHTSTLQGNYGNFTSMWDRILGTYLDPDLPGHQDQPLGLSYDQDFLGAITFGLVKLPSWVRERFHVDRYCNITSPRTASPATDRYERRRYDRY